MNVNSTARSINFNLSSIQETLTQVEKSSIKDAKKKLNKEIPNADNSSTEIFNKKISDVAIDEFKRKILELSSIVKPILRSHCSPQEYAFSVFEYFAFQFDDFFSFLTIIHPEDKTLQNKRAEFFKLLVVHRNRPKEEDTKNLKNIYKEVFSNILALPQVSNKLIEKIKQTEFLFDKFLEYPKGIDLPLAIYAGECSFKNHNLSITPVNLLKANNRTVEKMIKEAKSVFTFVETTLQKYKTNSPGMIVISAEGLLDILNRFKIIFLPICLKYQVKSFFDYNKYESDRRLFYNASAKLLGLPFQDTQKPLENFLLSSEEKEFFLKKIPLKFNAKPFPNKRTIRDTENAEAYLQFCKDIKYCHGILNALFVKCLNTTTILRAALMTCEEFDSKQKKQLDVFASHLKQIEDNNIKIKQNTQVIAETKSIEELLADIEGIPANKNAKKTNKCNSKETKNRKTNSRSSKQKRSANRNKKRTQTTNTKLKATNSLPTPIPTLSLKKTSDHGSSSNEVEKNNQTIHQLSELLAHLCQQSNDKFAQGCLRQAHMYLEDMILAHQNLNEKNLSDNTRRFYIMTYLQTTYFCLEALLHYENYTKNPNYIKGNGHNLDTLSIKAKISKVWDDFISKIYLVNYWVRQPNEQMETLQYFDIPATLIDIQEIYEAKDLHEKKLQSTIKRIADYFSQTKQFIEKLPSIKKIDKQPVTPLVRSRINLTPHVNLADTLKQLDEIYQKCQDLINELPPFLYPKFSQIINQFKLIKGIFDELKKEQISSDLFSLLVRHLIFWENSLLESFLQVTYILKTGFNTYSHDLIEMNESLGWGNSSFGKYLETYFHKLHNLCRYPFTTPNTTSAFHSYILKAELLRELSCGEDGFKKPNRKQEREYTKLNYMEPTIQLTSKDITEKLKETTEKMTTFINSMVIPQLKLCLAFSEEVKVG